jgi:hypothetical protein
VLRSDATIAAKQKQAFESLTALQTQKSEWQKLQVKPAAASKASNPVIMAVLGAAIGAFLVCAVACVSHISSSKVYSVRTLKNRTGATVLGSIIASKKKDPIQQWLHRLEGRNDLTNQASVLAAIVGTYCSEGKKLLIAGNGEDTIVQALVQELTGLGVQVAAHGSLLDSPKALQALPEQDAVLLAVQCGQSMYHQVEEEMKLAADHAQLLGCFVIDG